MTPTNGHRSVWAFLSAIRNYPGFGARVAVAACFTTVLANERGVETALVTVGAALLVSFAIGYPIWRRHGTRAARWN